MTEKLKINIYNIDRCGYYKHGDSEPISGDITELLDELKKWAFNGKTLAETCTYELKNSDSDTMKTYLFDMLSTTNGDTFISTWNETTKIGDNISSVKGDDVAGNAAVAQAKVPKGHIPGYPTYFWFIPQKNIFATLRFDNISNGHAGLKLLLSGFLEKFSSSVTTTLTKNTIEIHEDTKIRPSFKSSPARLDGKIDHLRKNWSQITKITRKSTLKPSIKQDLSFLQRMVRSNDPTETKNQNEIKIKSELSYQPTQKELEAIISDWENTSTHSSWNNVGFNIRGETDILWLSHTLVKMTLNLNVIRDKNGTIPLKALSDAITKHRTEVLKLKNVNT